MYNFAIVEDEERIRKEFVKYLKDEWPDSVVEEFADFSSALAAIADRDFDLIVSDIDLGSGTDRFGGFKLAKGIDCTRTPFIIVSGLTQPDLPELSVALDAWDYLPKPVNAADFIRQAKRALAFRKDVLQTPGAIRDGNLLIDDNGVTWRGLKVKLSMTHTRLVKELSRNINVTVPYSELFEHLITGRNKQNLRVHITKIREAFSSVDPNFDAIKNFSFKGYSWVLT